jgi:hypothetical protein
VRPEGLGKKKSTSSGREPVTFQLAAECLNHYATACHHYFVLGFFIHEAMRRIVKWTYSAMHSLGLDAGNWSASRSAHSVSREDTPSSHAAIIHAGYSGIYVLLMSILFNCIVINE